MDKHSFEYEVIADSNITGEITYGPYHFITWDWAIHRRGERRLLCLGVEQEEALPPLPLTRAKEFLYMASLFLRRRLVLGLMTRWDNKPSRGPSSLESDKHRYVDVDIIRGTTNLGELSAWLPLLEHLEPDKHNKFILSTRFYSQALEHIEVAPDMAYLELVSAIETLCQDANIGEKSLAEIDDGLAKLVNKVGPPVLKQEIEKAIIKRERFINKKFIKFIQQHTDESFWNYLSRPKEQFRINPADLERVLDNIYGQRSRTLHAGEPFPDYIFLQSSLPDLEDYPEESYINTKIIIRYSPLEEIPSGISITIGGRTWKSKDYIPYPHFFERLVNHVLKNYLKANQTVVDS
jgi:hypothetical protein